MDELFRWARIFFDADDSGGSADESVDVDTDDTGGEGDGEPDNAGGDGKTFTQEDVDGIIQRRLARERKAWEQQIEEERKKAQMTTEERLKAEKEEAEQLARDAQAAADKRLIQAEARVQAVAAGVKPDRVHHVLKLADLSDVDMGDDGDPDSDAVKAAIDAVLSEIPELKGESTPSKSGGEFRGGSKQTQNPWAKETFNLTEQGRIVRENPDLAKRLMREAKG